MLNFMLSAFFLASVFCKPLAMVLLVITEVVIMLLSGLSIHPMHLLVNSAYNFEILKKCA